MSTDYNPKNLQIIIFVFNVKSKVIAFMFNINPNTIILLVVLRNLVSA